MKGLECCVKLKKLCNKLCPILKFFKCKNKFSATDI